MRQFDQEKTIIKRAEELRKVWNGCDTTLVFGAESGRFNDALCALFEALGPDVTPPSLGISVSDGLETKDEVR